MTRQEYIDIQIGIKKARIDSLKDNNSYLHKFKDDDDKPQNRNIYNSLIVSNNIEIRNLKSELLFLSNDFSDLKDQAIF